MSLPSVVSGPSDVTRLPSILIAPLAAYRQALAVALEAEGVRVVAVAADVRAAQALPAARRGPAVAVADTGNEPRGRAIAVLRAAMPEMRVVAIAVPMVDDEVLSCINAGAAACLDPDATVSDISAAVRAVAAGETVCPPAVARIVFRRLASLSGRRPAVDAEHGLTQREEEVLELLSLGKSNKQIGSALSIAESTVKHHVHHILQKLEAGGRWEAAARLRAPGAPGGRI